MIYSFVPAHTHHSAINGKEIDIRDYQTRKWGRCPESQNVLPHTSISFIEPLFPAFAEANAVAAISCHYCGAQITDGDEREVR